MSVRVCSPDSFVTVTCDTGSYRFDIRQFVLVTSVDPLVIWFYDACYMRLASHQYSLTQAGIGDRFAHLCNYSVQRRTKRSDLVDADSNDGSSVGGGGDGDGDGDVTDEATPVTRVQSSRGFEVPITIQTGNTCSHTEYVKLLQARHGEEEGKRLWCETIQPAMHRAVVQTMRAATQSALVHRDECFELYGVDIILDHAYRPWLLEVNLSPALNHRTHYLTRLYKHMMNDLVDIVLETKTTGMDAWSVGDAAYAGERGDDTPSGGAQDDKTGHWVLIHKGDASPSMPVATQVGALVVTGTQVTRRGWRQLRRFDRAQRKLDAALVIVTACRRYLHRCRVWLARRNRAAITVQTQIRRMLAALFTIRLRRCIAATTIQCASRCRAARRLLARRKWLERRRVASTAIQHVARQWLAIQELARRRTARRRFRAARTLQCAARGRSARNELVRRRARRAAVRVQTAWRCASAQR